MRLIIILAVLLVASAAVAGEEKIFTADGGERLTSGTTGPASIDAAADGRATIKFMWLLRDGTVNAGDVLRSDPTSEFGNTFYSLRSGFGPRNFKVAGPDSVYVDLDTATEVIVTW